MRRIESSWTATYRGHEITVRRNERTRGFVVEWDARRIGQKTWSLFGVGTLLAQVVLDGRRVPIVATFLPVDRCQLTVDGQPVSTKKRS